MSLSQDLIGPGYLNTMIKEEKNNEQFNHPPLQFDRFIQKIGKRQL